MATKITRTAKEEILEGLEEKEWEDEQKWADDGWYTDSDCFFTDAKFYSFCPECESDYYIKGFPCNNCGFPRSENCPSLWEWLLASDF